MRFFLLLLVFMQFIEFTCEPLHVTYFYNNSNDSLKIVLQLDTAQIRMKYHRLEFEPYMFNHIEPDTLALRKIIDTAKFQCIVFLFPRSKFIVESGISENLI